MAETLVSTTDSQEEVNKALGVETPVETPEAPETPETPVEEKPVEGEAKVATEEEGKKPEAKKRIPDWQRSINKLTRQRYEEKERGDRLEAELRTVREQLTAKAEPQTFPGLPPKPTLDEFNKQGKSYEEYSEALARWVLQEQRAKDEQARAQEQSKQDQARAKEVFDSYNDKASEFRETHEDFDEVLSQPGVQIPKEVSLAVLELDNGPEVAYHLGKNPELCGELMEMSPLKAVARIGAISVELAGGKTAAPKKVASSAPPPIKPITGGTAKSSISPENMSLKDYRKYRGG